MRRVIATSLCAALLGAAAPPATPEQAVVDAARLAGNEFSDSLFLCKPGSDRVVDRMMHGSSQWLEPTRAFDNLWYIGNAFVGIWILDTGAGLVIFDAGQSEAEVRDHLEPGLRGLGLDPAQIRYAIITHGHWDHYGGAKYLQDRYGTRIAMSAADWDMLEASPPGSMIRAPMFPPDTADRLPPRRDIVVSDGQKLTLDDVTISLFVTPGHTSGTISAVVPVRDGGHRRMLSLLGGTAFPQTLEPTADFGGLLDFQRSVTRLARLSRDAKVVGLINTHIFADGSDRRLARMQTHKPGDANPFILGSRQVQRYYAMFGVCLRAAILRQQAKS